MTDLYNRLKDPENRHPFQSFIILIAFIIGGFCIGQFFGVILLFIFGYNLNDYAGIVTNPESYEHAWTFLMGFQAIVAIHLFILAPLAYLHFFEQKSIRGLNNNHFLNLTILAMAVGVVILSMPLNAVIIEWNKNLDFPPLIRDWALPKEQSTQELTLFITNFDTTWQLLFGLFVIAIIPGIGEELLFRGLMQPIMVRMTRNVHVGIWLTAFIFSFIHLQLYGLVPRMLLGALFGYLYLWSGNIIVPMIAHFVNNGFTLMVIYGKKRHFTDIDLESTGNIDPKMVLFSLAATVFLLVAFRLYYISLRTNGVLPPQENE